MVEHEKNVPEMGGGRGWEGDLPNFGRYPNVCFSKFMDGPLPQSVPGGDDKAVFGTE